MSRPDFDETYPADKYEREWQEWINTPESERETNLVYQFWGM